MDLSLLSEVGIGGVGLVAVVAVFAAWSSRQNQLTLRRIEDRLRDLVRDEVVDLRKWQDDHERHCHDRQKVVHGKIDMLIREVAEISGKLEK